MENRFVPRKGEGWYVADWTRLGWAETIIKLIAFVFAGITLIYALLSGMYTAPEGWRMVEVVILGLLSVGLFFTIFERFIQREVFAMVFVLVNNVAHWGMFYALLTLPGPGIWLPLFALFMLIGDLVKLRFFSVTDFILYTYPSVPNWLPYLSVGVFIVGYLLLILIGFATL